MVIEGKTIWIKSIAVSLLLLLIAITITTIYINTQSVSGKLSIVLDGEDNEWGNIFGWISPAGRGVCSIPITNYAVWLCCNSTSYPRECQIMWKDDEGGAVDIHYVRIYVNTSGIYAFIEIKTTKNTNITITLDDIKITTILSVNGFPVANVNLIHNDLNISGIGVVRSYGANVYGVEIEVKYSVNGSRKLSLEARKINTEGSGNIDNDTQFCVDSICSNSLVVSLDGVIINAYVTTTETVVPIPVPEPALVIAFVVLLLVSVVLIKIGKAYR
ncbi:MAG: hypothetical protein QW101_07115 [Ignisphaera sp.]|uniref:Uncharacterized protein n=1 Tax=Ignisphaera aggregans TaxID=334771 RepID=A0A7J3MYH4_9CREN